MRLLCGILILGGTMQRNGFTLIELIITVGLLALLGTLIAANMVGIQSRQLAANYESYKEQLQGAACVYIESRYLQSFGASRNLTFTDIVNDKRSCISAHKCYVKTGTLLDNGLIDVDLENPSTGFPVTREEVVQIEYKEGIKTCTYLS